MKPKYSLVRVRASRRFFVPGILATALAFALSVKPSQAQTRTWVGAVNNVVNGAWGTTTNWSDGNIPDTNVEIASFSADWTGSAPTFSLGADRTVNGIIYNDTGTSGDITGTINAGNTLTLAGTTPTITTTNSLTIAAPVALATSLTKAGSTNLTLSGVVSGTGSGTTVTVNAGTLVLTGANTFQGNVVVSGSSSVLSMTGGTFTTNNRLGTQPSNYKTVTLQNGGRLLLSSGNYNVNVPTATNVGAGQVFVIGTGGGTLDVASGSTLTIDDGTGAAGTAWTAPQLQGSGALTKAGAGTLSLGAGSSNFGTAFTGTITVSAGTLTLGNAGNPLGNTTSGTTISSGAALNLNGITQTATEPLTINGTGLTAAPVGVITNGSANTGTWAGTVNVASASHIGGNSGAITVNGVISGSGALTKVGSNTVRLTGNSTAYAAGISVLSGTLELGTNAAAAGTGTILLGDTSGSAAATLTGLSSVTHANAITVRSGSTGTKTLSLIAAPTTIFSGLITMNDHLTVSNTGTGALQTGVQNSANNSINLNGNTLTVANTGSGRYFTDGVVFGTGSVVVNNTGTGDYVPRGDHSYTGDTTITAGLVAVDRDSIGTPGSPTSGPFGTGTLIINGGQIRSGTGPLAGRTVGNTVTLGGDVTFYTVGGEKNLIFTGPVTLSGGNRTLTSEVGTSVPNTQVVMSGAIGDGGNGHQLIKEGAGNLVLGGANTYTGGTSVNAGLLVLSGSVPTNTALNVTPNSAAGAAFSLASGTANPMDNVSALSLGSVTGPTALGFELGTNTAGSDSIVTPVAASTAGVVNLSLAALPGFGVSSSYDLITAASGLSGATYNLVSAPGGYTYTVNATDSVVQVGLTPSPNAVGDIYWRGNTNGSWGALSGSNTNWFSDAAGSNHAQTNPAAANTVRFSTANAVTIGGVITTTLDQHFTVKNLVFGSEPNNVSAVSIAGGTTPYGASGTLALAPTAAADGIAVGSNAGNVTISAPVIVGADQTWSVDGTGVNGSSLTVSGPLSGAANLGISGLVTLSATATTSTFSGITTVMNGGVLQSGATNSFSGSSPVVLENTGVLRLNGVSNRVPTLTGTGIVQNNHASTAATLTVGDGTDFAFAGTLQNGASAGLALTKTGAGKLTLSGANAHTGMTTVNEGTLAMGSATALISTNNVTLTSTGTLDLNGFSTTIGSLSSTASSTITNTSSSTADSTATTVGTPSGAGIYVDALTITAAAPTMTASVTDGPTRKTQIVLNNANATNFLNFANGASNTFSGGLVLANNGTGTRMNINAAITGTPFGTGPIIIGQTALDRAGIYYNSADNTITAPIVMNTSLGTDRFGIRNDGRTITLSGVITAHADAVFSSNSSTASNTRITNQVTGAGGLVIDLSQTTTNNTTHTVTLETAPDANDYQGDTIVGRTNAAPAQNYTGILALGAADQIPNGTGKGNVVINNNSGSRTGTLSLGGFSDTINGLSGNGTVTSSSGAVTLTLGDNNATANFSGAINNASGTLSVTKIGAGTQTLSGSSNFAGALSVNGGFVEFATAPATSGPLGNSNVVNLNGGGIRYTSAASDGLNRPIAIGAAAGTVEVVSGIGTLTITTVTSSGGNLIKTGAGTAVISGSTSLNGGAASVVINEGTLRAGFGVDGVATISVAGGAHLDQNNGATQELVLDDAAGALTLSGGAQLSFELDGVSNDSIDTGAAGTAVTSGVVTLNFTGSPAEGTYDLISSTAGGLAGADYVIGTAPNGFNYTINKTDNLVSLTVSAQTPIYWRGGQDLSWNTLGSSTANWTTDGAGATDALSIPGAADSVIFSATGAPTAGNAIVSTLDAAFTVDSLLFTNTPSGITAVTIAAGSGGSLNLSPDSTNNGIRILENGGVATISAPLTVGAQQSWDVHPTGALVISGNTTFGANVKKVGAGAVTLSGNNTGSGGFNLSAGVLNLESGTALGDGALTIAAGTTINATSAPIALSTNNVQNWNGDFVFTGSNDLDLGAGNVNLGSNLTVTTSANALSVGGVISDGGNNRGFTKAGAGIMVLKGTNTHGGLTSITGGILRVTNNAALGSTATGTSQSGTSALELDGSLGALTIVDESLSLNGGGISDQGALRNIAGNNIYGGTVTLAAQSRINSDNDLLTLNHPTAVSSAGANLVVGGVGNTTIGGVIALGTGGVIKDGSGTLTLSGNNSYTGNTTVNGGTLNLTGSINGLSNSTVLAYGGSVGNTVVNVSGNYNGYLTTGANVAGSVAVLNQTAGNITVLPPNGQSQQYLANNGGYGMLNITGGTFTTGRFDGVGLAGTATSAAVIYIGNSGTLNQNVGDWFLPIRNNGLMTMTVAPGGTFTRQPATTAQFSITGLNGTNTYGVFNVAGGNVDTGLRGINFSQSSFSPGTGNVGLVNVAGGTLTLGLNTALGANAGSTQAFFNFAGGTVRASNNMTAVIPASNANYTLRSTVFGAITNNNNANAAFNSQIGATSNFDGGLVVDTNAFNVTFTNQLLGAENSFGVTQADIGNLTLQIGNSGYIGAPMVQFSAPVGGGVPATGYALISGGQVTGIVITNPGTYAAEETPTITLTGGGGAIAPFTTAALNTPNTSAGLIKTGSGILTLSGANTYTGATTVNGGTLLLNGAAATSPTTSAITVSSGGTLAFTSTAASTLDLTGKSLTLSGGSLAFDVGVSGVNDGILVDNFTLTANSAFAFTSIGPVGGSYTLLTSTNPISNPGANTIAGQSIGRVNLTPTINANTITVTTTLDEGIWNQSGGGNWSLGNSGGPSAPNWDNYKPTVAGDAALFGSAISAPSTVVVDTPHALGYVRFDNANAYTIGTNGSSNLTFNNGGVNAVATVTSGSHTIAENVALLSNLSVFPAASTTLTMSGVISGASRALELNAPGSLVLSGENTYNGVTSVGNGTLTLSGNRTATATGGFSVGTVAGNTGTLNLTNGTFTVGTTGSNFLVGAAAGATGVMNQSGGTLTTIGNQLLVGNLGATGTYNLSGGTLSTINGSLGVTVGVNTNSTGTFNLSPGGNLSMSSGSTLQIARSDNNTATGVTGTFNQTGGTATVGILQMGGQANNANATATLNLTGGTFAATTFNVLSAAANSTSTINISGSAEVTLPAFPTARGSGALTTLTLDSTTGFLSPAAASATYMPANTFTNAYLTENGAKWNVPSGRNITVGQVLEDAVSETGTLSKSGAGVLALTGSNLYTGVTTILEGSLQLGSAGTSGSLAPAGGILNNATFAVNRTNTATQGTDFGVISGTGAFSQAGSGTTILNEENTYSGITSITAGTLQISAANQIGDGAATNTISLGGGTLRSSGGSYSLGANRDVTMTAASTIWADADTLTLDGDIANGANLLTLRGSGTIVVNGVIGTEATPTGALNIGVNAAGGQANVILNGNNLFTGNVVLPAPNTQPKATLVVTNSGALGVGPKTVQAAGGGEIYLQNNVTFASNITWTLSGVTALWNASGNNIIQGNINMASGNGDTALNSVSGSLTVTGNMAATATGRQLRLRGNGNGLISGVIANGSTANLPVLKDEGTGTWTISGNNTYTGTTSVTAGTLLITGSVAGTASAATNGILGGNGTVTGAATIATTGVLAPGVNNVDTMNFGSTLTLDSGSEYAVSITGNGVNDKVNVTGALTANGTIKVTLESYTPVLNDTFDIADAASITGTPTFDLPALSGGLAWDTSTFASDGQIKVVTGDPFLAWASGFGLSGGDAAKSADPDGDGVNNLLEFATNSDPTNGGAGARVYGKIHMIGGNPVLTYTVATRAAATFAANGSKQEATKDLIKYTIEGSDNLTTWNTVVVTELASGDATAVQSAIVPALPTLDTGWEWHTFRTDDNTSTDASDFIRLQVTEAP